MIHCPLFHHQPHPPYHHRSTHHRHYHTIIVIICIYVYVCPRGGERVKVEPLIEAAVTGKNYYQRWKMEGGIYMWQGLNLLIIYKGLRLHLNSHFMDFLFEHLSHYIFEIITQFSFFEFFT